MTKYFGSICLTDIPRECVKKAKNGKLYLNIEIVPRKTVSANGETHFVSAWCKKDERKEDVKYIFGGVRPSEQQKQPTAEDINNMPTVGDDEQIF